MLRELDVLRLVSDRLEAANLPFMFTGSFAMAYYGQPRMTRDLDLVVAMSSGDVDRIVAMLSPDFYIDADDVRLAVETERLFNLMHNASGIKVDLIVRKSGEYRRTLICRSGTSEACSTIRSTASIFRNGRGLSVWTTRWRQFRSERHDTQDRSPGPRSLQADGAGRACADRGRRCSRRREPSSWRHFHQNWTVDKGDWRWRAGCTRTNCRKRR